MPRHGAALEPSSPQAAPEIPDHELVRPIGRGSYGQVWLARSVIGAYRAVKVVQRASFSDERPFEREFAGLKNFEPISRRYPGFIAILHVGRNEPRAYFYCIMELADDLTSGQAIQPERYQPRTLAADLARRGKLPLSECLDIGLNLASGLKDLHRHGLVHRDIKPSNIIFINGAARLGDIGLVTSINEATTPLGTRGYAPPDDPGQPNGDLYSLGKVLYQISTGQNPEQFPELPVALPAQGERTQFIRFNEVILRACESTSKNRYQSAEAMHAVLSDCQRIGSRASTPTSTGVGIAGEGEVPAERERKLLSVLFVNIARAEQADPEGVQWFMHACVELIRPVLQRFGGAPAQTLSEGVMAVFGWPIACEDHVRRATQAALAIRQAVLGQRQQLETQYGFGFELRLSLNTGMAICGKRNQDTPPVGDLVDVASRLLQFAGPGQIVMTEVACKTARDYFFSRPLGEWQLHAKGPPLKVFEVTGSRELRTRLEAELERGLTPFVGRGKELTLLQDRFNQACKGRGQIVLVSGEAGVGKSRLLLEFQRSLEISDICWLRGRAISYGSQMAYLPVIDLLRCFFRIDESAPPASVRSWIKSETEALGLELLPGVPFIQHLLSSELEAEALPNLPPEQRRIKTFEALRNLMLRKAQYCPVVLVVEDLHWVDRTSEEFLIWLADSLSMARVLLVLTYRSEYRQHFPERSFVTYLTLPPLNEAESLDLASRALTAICLPNPLRKLVLEKAEGNPFFVEEMVRSLVESGALQRRDQDYEAVQAPSWSTLPDSIQEIILSRIDRLEESPRKALQLASVIGREFAVNLLAAIADLDEPLVDSLRKLKSLELIYERSVFPESTCFFKHALTQEVAYTSMLRQRRKDLHCLVAAAIEELYSGRLPDFYGLLAYHYQCGEEWARALDYFQRAAERSRRVGAYREEALQLGRGLEIAQRLGQSTIAADLRSQRGLAWVKCGLWAQAKPDLESALAELPTENIAARAELLSSLAGACFWDADVPAVHRYAEEGEALVQAAGGETLRADVAASLLAWSGASHQLQGDLPQATEFFERALAKAGGFCSAAMANYSMTLYWQGRIKEARELARESVQTFRTLSDVFAVCFAHPHLGLALAACGKYSEAARVFDEAKELARKHEIWTFHTRAIGMSAGFHLDVFDFKGSEKLAEETREQARSAGFHASFVSACLDLAFNYTRQGEVSRADRLVTEAAAAVETIGGWHQWLWEVRLQQARAEISCGQQNWPTALDCATTAVSKSRARGRIKYVVMGLETHARALAALGRKEEAIRDLEQAVQMARSMGDPALFLRAATTLLGIDGNDSLLWEARRIAEAICAELPDVEMRQRFNDAEPVRRLQVR